MIKNNHMKKLFLLISILYGTTIILDFIFYRLNKPFYLFFVVLLEIFLSIFMIIILVKKIKKEKKYEN